MNRKAKLMSRQQKLLDKWVESGEGKRFLSKGYVMWDDLPDGLITALTRVKDQETLWSDVERYLGDKASALRYGATDRINLRAFIKYMMGFYGPDGVYPMPELTEKDIRDALNIRLKKHKDVPFDGPTGDTTDREYVRDIIMDEKRFKWRGKDIVEASSKMSVASELVLVAKDLMAGSEMSPMGLRKAVAEQVKKRPVYAIIEATFDDGMKDTVSGNLLRLGAWLQDADKAGTVTGYEIIGFTTDRNEARKKATEV